MDSEEDLRLLNFSSEEDDNYQKSLLSHSELGCESEAFEKANVSLDSNKSDKALDDASFNDDKCFFSSVADLEDREHFFYSKESSDLIENDNLFTEEHKRIKIESDRSTEDSRQSYSISLDSPKVSVSQEKNLVNLHLSVSENTNFSPEIGFKTGNNKKILVNENILKRAPKFSSEYKKGPMRSYNCPVKGHVSSEINEKNKYFYFFEKMKNEFPNVDTELLKIFYRWAWINLFLQKNINYRSLIVSVQNKLKTEYSILRRIIEGDDISYRYMILLVLSVKSNTLEVFDGFFCCKIQVDSIISKLIESKKLVMGFKIKLFGCKLLINHYTSILDLKEDTVALYAYYNSFQFSLSHRKLGYRKKISFLAKIKDLKKEGGIVSCLKGHVKRIVESKYVVQVKGYRNSVENLEKELENIQSLIVKTKEHITNEDVKIKKYIKFILADDSGECLITSWMYIDDLLKDKHIMLCYLKPVNSALGLHLTTTKQTFMKFYEET